MSFLVLLQVAHKQPSHVLLQVAHKQPSHVLLQIAHKQPSQVLFGLPAYLCFRIIQLLKQLAYVCGATRRTPLASCPPAGKGWAPSSYE
ncbi:MAG: hypothetical protein DHS20C07_17630 [Methyloligella sp.]|nr:MAG: hypothetical protein DHS20C07_17630 [Methyloligella sp.]